MNKPIKSIIFDMDGTLLDSSYAMVQSVNYVRDSLGLPPLEKAFLEYHINQPDQDLPMLFYGTPQYVPEHRELFKTHYLENANLHVKVYDGVFETLDILKEKGIILSVATNASDFFAYNMLEHQKILHFFDFVVGANCVKSPKPEPDMLHLIFDKSQISFEHSLLVGDSIKDELAAKNAGIDFLFANWGYGEKKSKEKTINSLREIIQFLH